MAKKIKQETLNISMLNGASDAQKDVALPLGKCIRACAFITGADPAQPLNIAIKDTNGETLVPFSHFKDWQKGSGEYFNSMKQVNFSTRNIAVHLSTKTALTAALDIQILFVIEVE